jgi:hypothetical protein
MKERLPGGFSGQNKIRKLSTIDLFGVGSKCNRYNGLIRPYFAD